MKNLAVFLFVFSIIFSAGSSYAAKFEITPLLGYTFGGDFKNSETEETLDFDEGASYGVILGLKDQSKTGSAFYELLYLRQESSLELNNDKNFDVDVNYLHIGGRYGSDGAAVNPYVAAGIGVTYFDPNKGDSETEFSFSIGAGINVPLHEHVQLRFEGRGFGTVLSNDSSMFCSNNRCLIKASGDVFWQFTGFSGLVVSF